MLLDEIVDRNLTPSPWTEGENIPWDEPGFSKRMLREHLSQEHDAASRRFEIIDQQVNWIQSTILNQQQVKILDLACGPGLYTERLALLGHVCHGIDYSPASIEYAIATSHQNQLACSYALGDIRRADFPAGMGLVMLIYGEFNIFRSSDARNILAKAWQALVPGGCLLLEPHPYEVVRELGEKPTSWYSSKAGLFSDQPHIVLQENYWDEKQNTATMRYYVIEAISGNLTRYAQSMQAYQDDEYRALLAAAGFENILIAPGLLGEHSPPGLVALTGRKPPY